MVKRRKGQAGACPNCGQAVQERREWAGLRPDPSRPKWTVHVATGHVGCHTGAPTVFDATPHTNGEEPYGWVAWIQS